MSGPKGIEYQIQQAERERQRELGAWRAVGVEAARIRVQCEAMDIDGAGLSTAVAPTGDGASIRRAIGDLRSAMAAAESAIAALRARRRQEMVEFGLAEARERAAENAAQARDARIARKAASAREASLVRPSEEARADDAAPDGAALAAAVGAVLGGLDADDPELMRLGTGVLAVGSATEAAMCLSDLRSRVHKANEAHRRALEGRRRLDALRTRLDGAHSPPGSCVAAVQGAEAALERDEWHLFERLVVSAERSVTEAEEAEQPERDRRFVAAAVHDVLRGLGYRTFDIDLGLPGDTVVLQRCAGDPLGVQVAVTDAEVDLRTVRLSGPRDAGAETAADQALCADLPGVLEGMRSAGVDVTRVRRTPAGVLPATAVAGVNGAQAAASGGRAAGRTTARASAPAKERQA